MIVRNRDSFLVRQFSRSSPPSIHRCILRCILNSREGIFAESRLSPRVEQSGPNGAKTNSISQKLRHSQRSTEPATERRRVKTRRKEEEEEGEEEKEEEEDDDRHLSPCPPCEQRLPFMQTYSPADVYLFANLISVPPGVGGRAGTSSSHYSP